MDPRTQERVEQWDSRPFSGGYDGLSDLADADFSGAVSAAGTWLFMLNGRIVGVVDGTIETFERASGTAYEAPDPALPLLCTMEERGGDTRAKYYTNDTALREVDETLQEGSFTGYIELSENVLSGDYYAVYYGGRRMAAAYIGNAERLLTGDEAFERAADEVGIYEVIDVDIDVTDVPGADADDGGARTADSESETDGDADGPDSADADVGTSEPSADPTESALDSIDISDPDPAAGDSSGESAIGDVTIDARPESAGVDDAATDDVTGSGAADNSPGITAGDDADPLSESSSPGITDGEATTDAAESTASETDATAGDDEAPSGATGEYAGSDEPEADATPDAGSPSSSGPDPAEVEAAAQQLDENDISWTEDDVPSPSDSTPADESKRDSGPATPDRDRDANPPSSSEAEDESDEETEERFQEEAQWRETRSIPSIDPDNSESSASNGGSGDRTGSTDRPRSRQSSESTGTSRTNTSAGAESSAGSSKPNRQRQAASAKSTQNARQRRSDASQSRSQQRGPQRAGRDGGSGRDGGTATADGDAATGADQQRIAELTQRIETLEEARETLATKAEKLEAERDRLRSENEELSSTVDRLQSRIEELEAELERARQATGDESDTSASTQLSPRRALSETNLFVRYASKSQPTLETAHEGAADRSEVASNLRLEHHTGFDANDVAVDGQPFEEFLTGTMEYRFVDWLTEMLLYEIRDTGNADGLGDLYDAIPRIDRAELDATISLADDDTEDVPDQVSFDVVAFDKMGNPLVVANLNDSREPASQEMLEELEEAASAVKANYPDLASAVVVTSSYFEPGALEVAEAATSGGLLSRGSKLSYVNLSRKQGYHLCLVESRSEGFHMNVPEL